MNESIQAGDGQVIKTTPKDFFLHMGAIIALYISTWSFLALWFALLDEIFKNPLAYSDPYSAGISLAIAALVVIFPTFMLLSWIIHNSEKKDPEKRELRIRKWLVYLTTFLAGAIIVIDLIVLLYQFLSGQELTTAFVWKVVVVLAVIGAIFYYYLYKIRKAIADGPAKYLTGAVALVVIASIVMGFTIMGSPQAQREKRVDQERAFNLQDIQWQVVNYWQQKEVLPESLSDLNNPISGYRVPTDPQTGVDYEYIVKGDRAFELCATFVSASAQESAVPGRYVEPAFGVRGGIDGNWDHEAGRTCFERTIDPELYPPYKNSPVVR